MTQEEIEKIFHYDKTHEFIYEHLDDNTLSVVKQILSVCNAQDFKEFSKEAKFDLTDVPIPISIIPNADVFHEPRMTKEVSEKLQKLLDTINAENTNKEYPIFLAGFSDDIEGYSATREMSIGNETSCQYDWKWIKNFVKQNGDMDVSIFHTHPNPLGIKQETLYNKYPNELAQFGVKPNGLNLSLSDIYAQMYLELIIEKSNPTISSESLVLMYDGNLIAFSTQNGVKCNSETTIKSLSNENKELVQ